MLYYVHANEFISKQKYTVVLRFFELFRSIIEVYHKTEVYTSILMFFLKI